MGEGEGPCKTVLDPTHLPVSFHSGAGPAQQLIQLNEERRVLGYLQFLLFMSGRPPAEAGARATVQLSCGHIFTSTGEVRLSWPGSSISVKLLQTLRNWCGPRF